MSRRGAIALGLLIYAAFLYEITQRRFLGSGGVNLVPFRTMADDWHRGGWHFVVDFVGNLVVFLPVGALLPVVFPSLRLWSIALIGLVVSAAIELGQYSSGRRMADVDDVTLNVLSFVIGYAIHRAIAKRGDVGGSSIREEEA